MKTAVNSRCDSVLVVEDNRDIREAVELLLQMEGFRVYGVQNGKEAVSVLKKIPGRALVLLDMMMPVMSGWDFFKAQSGDQSINNLPVVVVSALGAASALADKGKSLPAVGYIKKPIELDGLLDVVQRYCDRAKAQQQVA